jgi:signal transduction histidine kinase
LEAILDRLLEAAQELTGARYVALGVLDTDRRDLERFLTRGVDESTRRAIGRLPRGRGLLGVVIENPRPLRLRDLGDHPRSCGFPAGHPEMRGFLGVPVLIRGEAFGNLYLTEKDGGEFDQADEEAAVVLAQWAAIAIENARLYQNVDQRRRDLERAVASLEATTAIARAVGGETRLDRVLELIVERARALVEARTVLILLQEGDELAVAATAGEAPDGVLGRRIPIAGSVTGGLLRSGQPERVLDLGSRLQMSMGTFGFEARSALLVPMMFRGRGHGVLAAYDRIGGEPEFRETDEQLMLAFAASAAIAVATAKSVAEERLRHSIESSEQERRRWARELHDETLQGLGGLRVLLSAALRLDDIASLRTAATGAVEQISAEIHSLRALILELRPAALDELGLEPAITALAERAQTVEGLLVHRRVELDGRLAPELESTIYRIVQEALNNVAKHARAEQVHIAVTETNATVEVEVLDDGVGIDLDRPTAGFGLQGMRERVELAGGTLIVDTAEPGTVVRAAMPAKRPGPPAAPPFREAETRY